MANVLVFPLTSVNALTSFFFSDDAVPVAFPKSFLCSAAKLEPDPFLAVFFKPSAITSDGITKAVPLIGLGLDVERFSINFLTIVVRLGSGDGLDLTTAREDEKVGCLSLNSEEEDGSEKYDDVEERASYELYRDEGFIIVSAKSWSALLGFLRMK